jgi:hypothetical protein
MEMENELFDATHLIIEYLETESPVIHLAHCVSSDLMLASYMQEV